MNILKAVNMKRVQTTASTPIIIDTGTVHFFLRESLVIINLLDTIQWL